MDILWNILLQELREKHSLKNVEKVNASVIEKIVKTIDIQKKNDIIYLYGNDGIDCLQRVCREKAAGVSFYMKNRCCP